MKNKFLFILIILSFVSNVLADEEIIFKAGEINILNEGNLVKAKDGSEVILPDNITITSNKFEYNKETKILIATGNVVVFDALNNIVTKSNKITYFKNEEKIKIFGNVVLDDKKNNIITEGDEYIYFKNEEKIKTYFP